MRDTARICESVAVPYRMDGFRDPRGCIIYDRGQSLVGAVNEVYCDPDTHLARYAEVILARGICRDEPHILYPLNGLFWAASGCLFMNDWIEDAIVREAHSYKRIMHLTAYSYETLDQAARA